jgi:hypothetical protein
VVDFEDRDSEELKSVSGASSRNLPVQSSTYLQVAAEWANVNEEIAKRR